MTGMLKSPLAIDGGETPVKGASEGFFLVFIFAWLELLKAVMAARDCHMLPSRV
jgi:hypothetical protein